MSYRPLNLARGQTTLQVKCLFLFGVFLLVVISVSVFLYWRVTKELVYEQNRSAGRQLVDQGLVLRHWERLTVLTERSTDFLPFIEDFRKDLSEQYEWRFIRPPSPEGSPPSKPENAPQDDFERQLLARLLSARPDDLADQEEPQYEERSAAGGHKYQYYQVIRAQDSCLSLCHNALKPNWERFGGASPLLGGGAETVTEGDLMGVVQVTIPNDDTLAAVSLYWNMLLAVAIITAFLAMIAFYVTIRYVVVKPLGHLREVSEAISRGNIAMRADIHTGDELEALAVAFNRMLRHLVTAQNELRQANVKLDGKVDELAQLNMQLYEMNRIKSDFMATMSHELRTPLNSILGFSDVLTSADMLDERHKRYVDNIQKSGQMLLDMINNILDLAKIESGKMEVQLSEFDVAQLIATQCDMARPLTAKKNIDLETRIQPDLPPMHQDQGRVHQVLNNLLSNAIKFTPEGGRIQVTAHKNHRDELILKVTDTGVGIAEEDQQTIFEKFRQGHTAVPSGDAMTREYSGTGLGLSIVRELCKLLGGEVSVQSALGTGSTFTVGLPWRLEKQPRLDSPLLAGFEEFARPRLEPPRGGVPEPVSTAGKTASDDEG